MVSAMWIPILIMISGFFVSGFGTMIGFGGGVFMIPILVILFHLKMHFAIGAVVVSLFPAALIASAFNLRQGLVDPVAALWLEIPTMIGAVAGAYLTSLLSVQILEIAFSLFLCYVAFKMFRSQSSTSTSSTDPKSGGFVSYLNGKGPCLERTRGGATYKIGAPAAIFFGGTAGLLAGLFGIGGGFLKTPIMIRIFRMPAKIAVATALFMIVFTSLVATITHLKLGHVHWDLALPLTTGFILGAIVGNLIKHKFSDHNTERMIAFGLALAALSTLAHAIWH